MKTIVTTILSACLAVAAIASGNKTSEAQTTYKLVKSESKITWVGKKVTGEHTGNVDFKTAQVKVEGDKLVGISAVVDMNSISCTDLEGDMAGKLVGHLKSDDFFGVEKHPEAAFKLSKVDNVSGSEAQVSGELVIKGKSHPVQFPAKVVVKGDKVFVRADVEFDRTKYDIKYGSGSFFDNLGDKAINDEVLFSVLLVAEK